MEVQAIVDLFLLPKCQPINTL